MPLHGGSGWSRQKGWVREAVPSRILVSRVRSQDIALRKCSSTLVLRWIVTNGFPLCNEKRLGAGKRGQILRMKRIGDRRRSDFTISKRWELGSIVQDAILDAMDHLEVLREKVAPLSTEIVQFEKLNKRYRRQALPDAQAHFAQGKRQQRLQQIQQELIQIAGPGGRVRSVEQMKEQHRSRPYLVKKAS